MIAPSGAMKSRGASPSGATPRDRERILRKYGYPPDKQAKATQTVLEQAEVLSALWMEA